MYLLYISTLIYICCKYIEVCNNMAALVDILYDDSFFAEKSGFSACAHKNSKKNVCDIIIPQTLGVRHMHLKFLKKLFRN